jgi:hypothetical protein
MIVIRLKCCGIMELGEIRDDMSDINGTYTNGEHAMKTLIGNTFYHPEYSILPKGVWPAMAKFRVAIFSQADWTRPYGENFAAYIREQKLGDVICNNFGVNPNSGNEIKVWMWTLDRPAVIAWAAKNCKAPAKMSFDEFVKQNRISPSVAVAYPPAAPPPNPIQNLYSNAGLYNTSNSTASNSTGGT